MYVWKEMFGHTNLLCFYWSDLHTILIDLMYIRCTPPHRPHPQWLGVMKLTYHQCTVLWPVLIHTTQTTPLTTKALTFHQYTSPVFLIFLPHGQNAELQCWCGLDRAVAPAWPPPTSTHQTPCHTNIKVWLSFFIIMYTPRRSLGNEVCSELMVPGGCSSNVFKANIQFIIK